MEGDQAQLKVLRRARQRPRLLILAAALLAVGVLIVVLRRGPDLRAGSEELESGRVDVASRTLSSYRITNRVESYASGEVTVSTDRVIVHRPFDALVRSYSDLFADGRRFSESTVTFGRFLVNDDVLAVPPDIPTVDRRADVAIEEMVENGYADERERRRVAGRVCRVYRVVGQTGLTEGLAPVRAGSASYDASYNDVCIDEAGLVLEDASFLDGQLVGRTLAIEVDEHPRIDEEMFELDEPTLGVREGGGSLLEVDPESRLPGGPFWDLPEAPGGFEKRGRFAVVPPQPGFQDPTQRNSIITLMTDVWTDGIDVLTVERGATQGGVKPFENDPNARRIDLGELGTGELRYGLRTSEVRVRTTGGRFVRVAGTLRPSRLVSIARALEPLPEGPLIPLD